MERDPLALETKERGLLPVNTHPPRDFSPASRWQGRGVHRICLWSRGDGGIKRAACVNHRDSYAAHAGSACHIMLASHCCYHYDTWVSVMVSNMLKGSKESDPRLNPGLYYAKAWARSTKPCGTELLIAPYSWTIYSSFGVTAFLCGVQRKVDYVDSRGSSIALEIFNDQELGNSVLNITRQKPIREKPNKEQIRTAPEITIHMRMGTPTDWDSLSGMLRELPSL